MCIAIYIRPSSGNVATRVVQKYIEAPLLLNNKKFDIRVWVLVTSFDPLVVYYYDNFYLRLCSADYGLDKERFYVS